MPPKKKLSHVLFPLAGLDRKGSYRQSKPFSSPDMLNVRPQATLKGRERGGSRPGLIESHLDNLNSSEVRFLTPMTLLLGDDFTAFSDTFSGPTMASAWTQASWASNEPDILPENLAYIDTSLSDGAVVLDVLPIDTSEAYAVEIFITPYEGEYHGKYQLYLRMHDTIPDATDEGVVVELIMTGALGVNSGTLTSLTGGVSTAYSLANAALGSARPGWLSAVVSGDSVTVYWNGVTLKTQTVPTSHTGVRVGFGMECTEAGGLCLADVFRVQYYSTGTVDESRTMLVASAGGDLYNETTYGRMTVVSSSLTVRDDVQLTATQSGQKLYVADYGDVRGSGTDGVTTGTDFDDVAATNWTTLGIDADDDVVVVSDALGGAVDGTYKIATFDATSITLTSSAGTGTCAYRIERAPKVYDPSAGTIEILFATDGQVPTGNPLICRYLDRIVLAGAEIASHVWYMSRQGDPLDWDYSQTDSQRAVAGLASEAGVPGAPITALAPHSDDYLIIGCLHSLWRLRGDPVYAPSLDALSHTVGIIGQDAWCHGPTGELIFLSLDGIYILPPGGNSVPISMSREVLPREFLNINPAMLAASLEYDIQGRGVHIYLTSDASNERSHWWFGWESKTFWPMTLDADYEPTATCTLQSAMIEDSGVILGGRDGTLRRFTDLAETDCGTTYSSYVYIGPIALAQDSFLGRILSMDAVMAEDSGDVTWELIPSLTFEGAVIASSIDTGTWGAGLNATEHPACRGQAYVLVITGTAGRKWALEQATIISKTSGRRRL